MIPLPAAFAIPRIGLRTALEFAVGLPLVAAVSFQTVRIEGIKIWPLNIAGLKAELGDARQQLAETKQAFATTVANYRAAAAQAHLDDQANAARVKLEQGQINERTSDAYEKRIADARARAARAERLRLDGTAAADSGGGRAAPVPSVPASAGRAAEGSSQDGLPPPDALTATEQAIQLEELIKWIRAQAAIDANGPPKGAKP